MKPSILKKLNLIIEEANNLKNKNKFGKAVDKFEQALNFINIKVDDPSEKKVEIESIRNAINQTYCVEIENIVQESKKLSIQKEFDDAKTNFQKALRIAKDKIDDQELRDIEINDIKDLIIHIEIEKLLIKGGKVRDDDKKSDEALKIFKDSINLAETLQETDGKIEILATIKAEINHTKELQFKAILQQGTELKNSGQLEEAIKVFEKSKDFIENSFSPDTKNTEIVNIKNLTNEIYSTQIKAIIEKGKESVQKGLTDNAKTEFNEALKIAGKMYESDLKNLEIRLIAESQNPIYIKEIQPILDEGIELTKRENFKESLSMIKETVSVLNKALDITNSMVNSERKEIEIKKISDAINQACLPGINIIKDRSMQLIGSAKDEEAINEIYIALSLAKLMAYPEGKNKELEDLKNLVNKVYSTEIKKVLKKGNELLEKKENEKALDIFNEALNITNKMYLTDEMDKEVNMIKSLIYETEVKLLVGKGKISEEQTTKEKEIEKLNKRFEYAKSIEDDERRAEEMSKIKKLIDDVHSEEIKLLIEQGNHLADQKSFEEAFNFYERALRVNKMMEEPDVKNKDLIKDSYKKELIKKARIEIEKGEYDIAIEDCKRSMDLDIKLVEAYVCTGIAYYEKKKYQMAIDSYKEAVELDNNNVESLHSIGLAYEHLNDLENAKHAYEKTLEINPKHTKAYYNLANIYKQSENLDKAIEYYIKTTELEPDFAIAWFFLGSTYFDKKDYNSAIEHLEKAIRLDPNLANEVNPLIKDLKGIIDKLHQALSLFFLDKR